MQLPECVMKKEEGSEKKEKNKVPLCTYNLFVKSHDHILNFVKLNCFFNFNHHYTRFPMAPKMTEHTTGTHPNDNCVVKEVRVWAKDVWVAVQEKEKYMSQHNTLFKEFDCL